MSASAKPLMNHLLFHKAIIDEEDDGGRFDHYMKIAASESSEHIADPIDRAFYHLFEIVIDQNMDPWSIDLSSFCAEYHKKLKGEKNINFIVTGRIIFLAYRILRLKSDELNERCMADQQKEPVEPTWEVPSFFDEPFDVDYGGLVMEGTPPLKPPVKKETERPVSLMELMDALEEARAEAAINVRVANARKKLTKNREKPTLEGKVHEECIADDIRYTWEKITEYGSENIPLHDLYGDTIYDFITVFTSLLFLAQMKKVDLKQRALPHGEISVRVLEKTVTTDEVEDFSITLVSEAEESKPSVEIPVVR